MNILRKPNAYEFAGNLQDLVIDTDATVNVQAKYNGKLVLDEEYSPDANNVVRVRHLNRFCALSVWGQSLSYRGEQHTAGGVFTFLVDGADVCRSFIYYSNHWRKATPPEAGALTDAARRITYPGAPEIVSGFPLVETVTTDDGEEEDRYYIEVEATTDDINYTTRRISVVTDGSMPYPYTIETGVEQVEQLTGLSGITRFRVNFRGGGVIFIVSRQPVANLGHLRFRNLYDLPDVVHFRGGLEFDAQNESETAQVGGIKRRFGIRETSEYKVLSGALRIGEEYRLWRDLCNSSEVELYAEGYGWLPVTISKQKLTTNLFNREAQSAELTLKLADERLHGASDTLL